MGGGVTVELQSSGSGGWEETAMALSGTLLCFLVRKVHGYWRNFLLEGNNRALKVAIVL